MWLVTSEACNQCHVDRANLARKSVHRFFSQAGHLVVVVHFVLYTRHFGPHTPPHIGVNFSGYMIYTYKFVSLIYFGCSAKSFAVGSCYSWGVCFQIKLLWPKLDNFLLKRNILRSCRFLLEALELCMWSFVTCYALLPQWPLLLFNLQVSYFFDGKTKWRSICITWSIVHLEQVLFLTSFLDYDHHWI